MSDAAAPPIVVGRVRKPHGLKGDVAIFPLTDSPDLVFTVGRELTLLDLAGEAHGTLMVTQARIYHRECLLRFAGHDRREAVEELRDMFLGVPRDVLPPLDEGEVYQQELEGFAVRSESDEPLGIVSAVYELPAGLTIEVQGVKREFLLPWRPEYVKQLDRDARTVTVAIPEGLLD